MTIDSRPNGRPLGEAQPGLRNDPDISGHRLLTAFGNGIRRSLGIIVVNYQTADLAINCLLSLVNEIANTDGRVIVVDNHSADGSAERLRHTVQARGWESWVEVIGADDNRGFAGGNNTGLRWLLALPQPPAYFLLLNPDTVARPGALAALLEFMEEHPDVGIGGSRLEDPDGTAQRSAFRFPTVRGEFEGAARLGFVSRLLAAWSVAPPVREGPHPTDWVAGACMIIRREVFETAGLLDEGYFLYFEEVDFCLRARRAGWPCWYVPGSRVVHLVGQSSGVTDSSAPPRRRPPYWFASRRRYFRRNHHRLYATLADVAWAAGFASWRFRRWLQRKPDTDPPYLLWDFVRLNFLGSR